MSARGGAQQKFIALTARGVANLEKGRERMSFPYRGRDIRARPSRKFDSGKFAHSRDLYCGLCGGPGARDDDPHRVAARRAVRRGDDTLVVERMEVAVDGGAAGLGGPVDVEEARDRLPIQSGDWTAALYVPLATSAWIWAQTTSGRSTAAAAAVGYSHAVTTPTLSPFGRSTPTNLRQRAAEGGAMLALPLSMRKCRRRSTSSIPALSASPFDMGLRTRAERTALMMAPAPRLSMTLSSSWPGAGLRVWWTTRWRSP